MRGKRCSCSPSNCALRAVAGNERGTTEGTVHSILFLPLLSFFVFSSCSICYLGLFTLRQSLSPSLLFFFFFFLFFSVSLSPTFSVSFVLPTLSSARTVLSPPVAYKVGGPPLYCICDLFLYYVPHAARERGEIER